MEDGDKFDSGKLDWSLLPYRELEEVVRVFQYGAEKYGKDNWRGGFRYNRLFSAMMRHLVSFKKGKDLDESGMHHLAHVCASALMLLAHHNQRLGTDDRER